MKVAGVITAALCLILTLIGAFMALWVGFTMPEDATSADKALNLLRLFFFMWLSSISIHFMDRHLND